ncbi:unnamed protein product [marine sediment metagenome]|uniref:Uncharacterized protein n=1 Tax=marine sediment metagenome TaxID=412755 RepID=X0TBZ8_9ZZZZ
MLDGMQDLKDMMKGLDKKTQTHVNFDNDKIMLKKENLEDAEEKVTDGKHQMHLTLKSGKVIILKNTNYAQYCDAWNK